MLPTPLQFLEELHQLVALNRLAEHGQVFDGALAHVPRIAIVPREEHQAQFRMSPAEDDSEMVPVHVRHLQN